jgi:hypothetical protein
MTQPTRKQMNAAQLRANAVQARTAKKLAALANRTNRSGGKALRTRTRFAGATRNAGTFKKAFGGTPPLILKIHRGALAGDKYAQKKGALVDTNMMGESHGERLLEWQLDMSRHANTNPMHLFKHISLSRPEGHSLDAQTWKSVCQKFLTEIGAAGVQFVAYRHADTKCDHIHVIFSRVKPDGSLVSESNNFFVWREALRRVETAMGMVPIHTASDTPAAMLSDRYVNAQRRASRLGTTPNRLDPHVLQRCALNSNSFEAFQAAALACGVEVSKALKNERTTGVLYRKVGSEEWLAGSTISRQLTLPVIEKQFARNRQSKHPSPHEHTSDKRVNRERNH